MTPKPLEYVTIDRGSASTRGEDNPFVTPLPGSSAVIDEFETSQEDDEELQEVPKSGRGSVRDLE